MNHPEMLRSSLPFHSGQNGCMSSTHSAPTQLPPPPFAHGHMVRNGFESASCTTGFTHNNSLPIPSRSFEKRIPMAFGAHSINWHRTQTQNLGQRRRHAHQHSNEQELSQCSFGQSHAAHSVHQPQEFHSGYGPAYGGRQQAQADYPAQFTQRPSHPSGCWQEAQMPTTSHSVHSTQQPSIRRDRASTVSQDGRSLFSSVTMRMTDGIAEPAQFPPRLSCFALLNEKTPSPLSSPDNSPPRSPIMVPMMECTSHAPTVLLAYHAQAVY